MLDLTKMCALKKSLLFFETSKNILSKDKKVLIELEDVIKEIESLINTEKSKIVFGNKKRQV